MHHDHDHAHDHGQSGDYPHEDAPDPAPLAAGAGAGKLLFFDAFSGVAGDMTIAAFLDLGVPFAVVERAIGALPLAGVRLRRARVRRSAIVATRFEVEVGTPQPERTHAEIDALLAAAPLAPEVQDLARRIFLRLAEAEAAVHGVPVAAVHFHEVGAVDAIADVVGAAACATHVGAEVVASPLPLGRGLVATRHGPLPLPAPATLECLRGVPTHAVDRDFEFVTPTGAAIVATLAASFQRWPPFAPERIGHGAGSKDLPDRPNLLRLVLGSRAGVEAPRDDASHVVLAANVDDLTGEVAAYAIEALLAAGALDAWAAPITMKKGRPGLTISALAAAERVDALAAVMLRETTTIGVRMSPVGRVERPRRVVSVATRFGPIRIKISEGPFGPPQVKPELDDCAAAARERGVPLREVLAAALAAALGSSTDR